MKLEVKILKKFKLLFTLIFASLLISFTNISCDITWTTTDETNLESNDSASNANNNDSGSSNSPNNTNNNNANTDDSESNNNSNNANNDDSETETSDTESSDTEPSDTEVVVTSLSISGDSEVTVGSTITLTANVTPSTAKVTWNSNNTKIATVSNEGVVTGVKTGNVTITAKAGKKSKSKTITVTAANSSGEDEPNEDVEASGNLITTATVEKVYFAPNWIEQFAEVTGSFSEGFTYPLPASTAGQWQAQLHLATDAVLSTSKTYKLSFTANTTVAMNNITVKWASDTTNTPAASSMCNSFNTSANTAYNYSYIAIPESNITNAYLILDFGGNGAGTVKISNISLVETSSVAPEIWNDETASAGAEPKKQLELRLILQV